MGTGGGWGAVYEWCGKLIGGTWSAGMCVKGVLVLLGVVGDPVSDKGCGKGGTGWGVTSTARRRSCDGREGGGNGEVLRGRVAGRGP